MGNYVNPGNIGFKRINGPDYVDKTMLIDLINARIGTDKCLVCVSRPRRFGKSYAAKMLTAYYDTSCDSHSLFDDKKIAQCASYTAHLNQYHVINLDITSFISEAAVKRKALTEVPQMIIDAIHDELMMLSPDLPKARNINDEITWLVDNSGKQFVFIIDEWDALIREAKDVLVVDDSIGRGVAFVSAVEQLVKHLVGHIVIKRPGDVKFLSAVEY